MAASSESVPVMTCQPDVAKWRVITVGSFHVIKQENSDGEETNIVPPIYIKKEPKDYISGDEHPKSDHNDTDIKQEVDTSFDEPYDFDSAHEEGRCENEVNTCQTTEHISHTKHVGCDKCGIQKKKVVIYKCTECPKEFKKRWIFLRHQKIHTGEKDFKCEDCGKSYTQLTRLKKHRTKHTGEVLLKCLPCKRSFLSEKKFKLHHFSKHSDVNLYQCDECNKFCIGIEEFKSHALLHQKADKASASKDKTTRKTKIGHTDDHSDSSDVHIKQEVCSENESNEIDLNQEDSKRNESHKILIKKEVTSENDSSAENASQVDSEIFIKPEPVSWVDDKPAEPRKYICSECGRGFNVRSNFNRHKRTHTGEKRHKCDDCAKCFTQLSQLRKHRTIHTGETLYKCKVCGKTFLCEIRHKEHESNHTGPKPFKCEVCNRTFSWAHEYKMHVLIHTGEKPFSCDECGRSFARLSNLKGHKRLHAGHKPYTCEECQKSFSRLSNLKVHLRTHTGEKPYKCKNCGYDFSSYSSFTYHSKKVDCKAPGYKPNLNKYSKEKGSVNFVDDCEKDQETKEENSENKEMQINEMIKDNTEIKQENDVEASSEELEDYKN